MRKTTNYKRFQQGGAVVAEAPPATPPKIELDPDDASEAFQRQIQALKQSEEIQRQRQAANDAVARVLRENPAMLRHPEITKQAEIEALRQGVEPYSEQFHQVVVENFNKLLSPPPVRVPEPASFEPLSRVPARGSHYSAPPSRETNSNGYSEGQTGSVRLSPAMKEAARIAGVDEITYAEQLLRLRKEKESGNYGGAP